MNVEEVSSVVVDTAFHLHRDLGPGLLESVYEAVLARMLEERGLRVDGCLVIELKSVEKLAPVHAKQLLTYLRLLNLPVGLLINFGVATFKEGIRRVVNNHQDFASSRESESRGHAKTRRGGLVDECGRSLFRHIGVRSYQLWCSNLQGRHQHLSIEH